jgi:hypothetical protein
MFPCPHCQKQIEVSPQRKVRWWRHDLTPGLGCGSLLAIGIIVAIFSGGPRDDKETRALRDEVRALATKVDALTNSVRPTVSAEVPALKTP